MWRRGAVVVVAVCVLGLVPRPAAGGRAEVLLRIDDPRGVWIFWGESKALFLHLTNRCREN